MLVVLVCPRQTRKKLIWCWYIQAIMQDCLHSLQWTSKLRGRRWLGCQWKTVQNNNIIPDSCVWMEMTYSYLWYEGHHIYRIGVHLTVLLQLRDISNLSFLPYVCIEWMARVGLWLSIIKKTHRSHFFRYRWQDSCVLGWRNRFVGNQRRSNVGIERGCSLLCKTWERIRWFIGVENIRCFCKTHRDRRQPKVVREIDGNSTMDFYMFIKSSLFTHFLLYSWGNVVYVIKSSFAQSDGSTTQVKSCKSCWEPSFVDAVTRLIARVAIFLSDIIQFNSWKESGPNKFWSLRPLKLSQCVSWFCPEDAVSTVGAIIEYWYFVKVTRSCKERNSEKRSHDV